MLENDRGTDQSCQISILISQKLWADTVSRSRVFAAAERHKLSATRCIKSEELYLVRRIFLPPVFGVSSCLKANESQELAWMFASAAERVRTCTQLPETASQEVGTAGKPDEVSQ